MLTGRRRFDIDVISAIPRDWTKWGGFSGAAIFADDLLVGVVRTVDENWNGGVLEATPAVWLLDDSSFKEYFEDAGLPIPNWLDAGAVDRILPLDFEADVSIAGTLRFSPRNPRVPFLGRETEVAALDEFLTAERRQPFTWWVMTGGGGAGKTRLARELCLRARRRGWRAGFLPGEPDPFKAAIASLDAWCPRTPTLIVADYVMKRIEVIRTLAARLARREGLPRLRLLLLEREAGKLFENRFFGSDQSNRGVIERALYNRCPLDLGELTYDQIWALVEPCPWRIDTAHVPVTRAEFFARFSKLDSQRRPLMAMILADALATSADRAGLGELETELRDLLRRDRDHLWPKELGVADTPVGKTEADIAIAFATMVDGLGPPELEAIKVARGKPIDPAILPACGIAIGKPLGSVPRLGRLEPDLIGEFFALETLRGDPNNPFAEAAHSWMPETAWRARGSGMFDFVARSKQTFPKHVAIQQVDITVKGVRESWLLSAFAVLSRANDPTEGFDAMQAWLRPRAQTDAGAALAFADLTMAATSLEAGIVGPRVLIALFEALGELHQVHPNEPALREQVAKALFNLGVRLGELGRSEEAIAVYDDLLARFGTATELPLREQVARALVSKGVRLGALGRSEEAIAVYDDLLARFGTATELPLREQVARALVNKGVRLGALGRSEDAIAVYDDLLARFGTATELPLREQVAGALFNKGFTLGALGRSEDEIAVYDDLLARFGTAHRAAAARTGRRGARQQGGQARRARPQRGRDRGLRRSAGPLRHGDRAAAARTGRQGALQQGGHARRARPQRGRDCGLRRSAGPLRHGDRAAAARTGRQGARQQGGHARRARPQRGRDCGLRRSAGALRHGDRAAAARTGRQGARQQGVTLGALGRSEEAIAVYDDLLARFGTATELPLREQVARALVNKGVTLGALGRSEEAIAVYDDLLARFGTATELPLREQVARALVNKGVRLGALDRSEDAIAVYDDLLARFGTATELPLREQVARALVNKGVRLGALDRSAEAIAVYDDLLARFGTATELPLREQVAKALFNKGFTLGALGRSDGRDCGLRRSAGPLRHGDRAAAARTGRQGARQQGGQARRARPQRGRDRGLRRSAGPLRHGDRAAAARTGRQGARQQGVHARRARPQRRTRLRSTTICWRASARRPSCRCANRSPRRSSTRGSRSARSTAARTRLRSTTICWPASARRPSCRCANRSPGRSSARGSRSARSAAARTRLRSTTICWPASARRPSCRCANRSPGRSSARES